MIRHFIPNNESTKPEKKECEWCMKPGYETAEEADGQIRIARMMDGVRLKKYYCDFINGWHLTKDR